MRDATAARPTGLSGALHTSGAWSLMLLGASPRSPARPRHRPPAPRPCPTAAHQHRGHAPPQLRVSCSALACGMAEAMPNFARNSPATISNLEFRSLELQRFLTLLKLCSIELRATFLGIWPCLYPRVPQQASAPASQFRMQFLRGCFMV